MTKTEAIALYKVISDQVESLPYVRKLDITSPQVKPDGYVLRVAVNTALDDEQVAVLAELMQGNDFLVNEGGLVRRYPIRVEPAEQTEK